MRNTNSNKRGIGYQFAARAGACALGCALVACGADDDEDTSASQAAAFAGWEGAWSSYQRYMGAPEVDAAYEAIATEYNETYASESGESHTAASVEAHWAMLYGTDFSSVTFDGSEASFQGADGGLLARCSYRTLGCQEVFYVGDDNAWQLEPDPEGWSETWCGFESADQSCGVYNRLVMTDFHLHEGQEDAHGHLRYADTALENLWDDGYTGHGRNNHYWWPTLVSSEMTAADYAALETTNKTENAEYLTY